MGVARNWDYCIIIAIYLLHYQHPLQEGEQSLKPTNTLKFSTFTYCPEEILTVEPDNQSPQSIPGGRRGQPPKAGLPSLPHFRTFLKELLLGL